MYDPVSYAITHTMLFAISAGLAVGVYRRWRTTATNLLGKVAICIGAMGALGLFASFWLAGSPPDFLEHFELPNDPLQGVHLTAPDGRVFIASPAIMRMQRYGPEGFEKGFMYALNARSFRMSASGNILICGRTNVLLTLSADGNEVPPRRTCHDGVEPSPLSYASRAQVPGIAFNWISTMAVPLWNPIAGWLIAILGSLLLRFSSSKKSTAS